MAGSLRKTLILLVVLAIAILAGCATTQARLDGPEWRLSAWSVSSVRSSDFTITARCAAGAVMGRSGVNTYRGSAVIGPGSSIAFGPMATTRMAGPEPAMRAEGIYLDLLARVGSYRVDERGLTLFDAKGNELLVFVRAGE